MRFYPVLLLALAAGGAATLPAQSALRPNASGRGTSEVTLAYPRGQEPEGAKPVILKLDYGQPHLRGRALHTDSLVPYDKPWRTGANALTTFQTDVDLVVGGTTLAKGTYVLFTIPSRTTWKLIFQKNVNQSPTEYDQANDVARVDLRRTTLASPVESLTMWVIPSTAPGAGRGELRIAWGTFSVSTDWMVK